MTARPIGLALLLAAPCAAWAQPASSDAAVAQLRHVIGAWEVDTEFIDAEGRATEPYRGCYEFEWVVSDRVVRGMNEIASLDQRSAFLLHADPEAGEMVQAAVGADGYLWIMRGPEDGETRTTPNRTMPDGSSLMLRFTRHGVAADSFRSRMEISTDGGATWRPGNRQHFVRSEPPGGACPVSRLGSAPRSGAAARE